MLWSVCWGWLSLGIEEKKELKYKPGKARTTTAAISNRMFVSLQGIIFSVLIASNFPVISLALALSESSCFVCAYFCLLVYRMYVVYRFLLLWKFVCSFILPLFYLIFPPFAYTKFCSRFLVLCTRDNNNDDDDYGLRLRWRPCFIVHARLCIHNNWNTVALVHTCCVCWLFSIIFHLVLRFVSVFIPFCLVLSLLFFLLLRVCVSLVHHFSLLLLHLLVSCVSLAAKT